MSNLNTQQNHDDICMVMTTYGHVWSVPYAISACFRLRIAQHVGMARKRIELTRELADQYCKILDKTTPSIAAAACGLSLRQVNAWLAEGSDLECTDETLRYLVEREGQVQSGGTRARIMESLLSAADCDPRVALEVAKMLMPSLSSPKQVEVKATVEAVRSKVDFSKLSDDQLKVLEQAEAIKALAASNSDD